MEKIFKNCPLHGMELDETSLKPGLYAVSFKKDGHKNWGLVNLTSSGMAENWNVAKVNEWNDTMSGEYTIHWFKPTAMEKQLFDYYIFAKFYDGHYQQTLQEYDTYRCSINEKYNNFFHRIAEKLVTFFS